MSRCFPFPPPGYEKKARSDDADLLNKEKQREKKSKKEKKDKKDKDRSDGKHRDKKDRKEKSREKKKEKEKEKERDKDKVKNTPSEERLAVQSDICNRGKLNQKENERDKDKEKNNILDEKKQALQFQGHSGDKPIRNSLFAERTGDFKFVQELCRRIIDDEGTGSQLVDRTPVTGWKNNELDRIVVNDARILAGAVEKNNEKGVDSRMINGVVEICSDIAVQNLVGLAQDRVEGMPRPMDKQIGRRTEEKEKSKERKGRDKRGEKRKDKEKEKKSHGKDKEREKKKKKERKVREKSEHKTEDVAKLKDTNKNDQVGTLNARNTHIANNDGRNTATEGILNLKKRKDLEANGFLHASDARPNKMPRPSPYPSTENGEKLEPCHTAILLTSNSSYVRPVKLPRPSPHPSVENGKKLEPYQAPILLTSDRQAPPDNLKLNRKELKVNGVINSLPLPIFSKKSPSPSRQADKIVQASTKPPHPDSKYLSQVLSVPKMEEFSDFDDQEWLFSSKDCSSEKKPKVGPAESQGYGLKLCR